MPRTAASLVRRTAPQPTKFGAELHLGDGVAEDDQCPPDEVRSVEINGRVASSPARPRSPAPMVTLKGHADQAPADGRRTSAQIAPLHRTQDADIIDLKILTRWVDGERFRCNHYCRLMRHFFAITGLVQG